MANSVWKYYWAMYCAICASLNVPHVESNADYSAKDTSQNWDESNRFCKTEGQELARVSNAEELAAARRVFIPGRQPRNYWIGLKYASDGFKWSDGTTADGVESILSPEEATNTTSRCFYVTEVSTLQSSRCIHAQRFICQTKESVSTPLPPVIMNTIPSPSVASVAAATLGHIESTIGNSNVSDPYALIREYVKNLEALDSSDSSSLKEAVDMASEMVHGLKTLKKDGRGTANLLIGVDQLEKFGLEYAERHLSSTNISIKFEGGDDFVVILQKIPAGVPEAVTIPSQGVSPLSGTIVLPRSLFKSQEMYAVLVVFYDKHQLLPGQIYDNIDGNPIDDLQLLTSIMSMSVSSKALRSMEEDINLTFSHVKDGKSLIQRHCVFWNFSDTTAFNGTWSSDGCHVKTIKANETVCSCKHLTSFAVLVQVQDTKVPKGHKLALEVITFIGCALSLLSEAMTALVYIILLKVNSEEIQIRLNLVVSLAAAHTVFLAGINATDNQAGCMFIAVLLHYLFLVAFDWMLLEGLLLYLKVVRVFNVFSKIKLFYVFAWGFPIGVVLLSILIASRSSDGYSNTEFCWVSFSSGLVWTFVTPVMVIVMINTIIIARVVGEMTKLQNIGIKEMNDARQGVKTCVVLCPLLGVTWIFGILSVTDAGLFFQYTFTILNSMQGVFIFLLHVVRNNDVRTAFEQKKQRWRLQRTDFNENGNSRHRSSQKQNQVFPLEDCEINQAGERSSHI